MAGDLTPSTLFWFAELLVQFIWPPFHNVWISAAGSVAHSAALSGFPVVVAPRHGVAPGHLAWEATVPTGSVASGAAGGVDASGLETQQGQDLLHTNVGQLTPHTHQTFSGMGGYTIHLPDCRAPSWGFPSRVSGRNIGDFPPTPKTDHQASPLPGTLLMMMIK